MGSISQTRNLPSSRSDFGLKMHPNLSKMLLCKKRAFYINSLGTYFAHGMTSLRHCTLLMIGRTISDTNTANISSISHCV